MEIKLLNVVVFAEQYENLIAWYQKAFDFETLLEESGKYHYTELGKGKHVIVGITPAQEVKHTPKEPRNNSNVMQLAVQDIQSLFERIESSGGKILFGPAQDEHHGFQYGGVADIEGNEIWLVQVNN